MRRVIAAGVVLLTAACASVPATPPSGLSGVDLSRPVRLIGTEPFWGVDIQPASLIYSGVDRPEQRAPNPGPRLGDGIAVWATTTDRGLPLVVTLTDTECSDGMSDRVYPLTASVRIGQETLTGCAASSSALTR